MNNKFKLLIENQVATFLQEAKRTISVGEVAVSYSDGPYDYQQKRNSVLSSKTINNLNLLSKYGLKWNKIYIKRDQGTKSFFILGKDTAGEKILYSRKEGGEGKQGSTDLTSKLKTKAVKDVINDPLLFTDMGIDYNSEVDVTENTINSKEFYFSLIKALNGKKVDIYTLHTNTKHFNNKAPDPYLSSWGIAYSITPKPYYIVGDKKEFVYGTGIIYIYPTSGKVVINPPSARSIEYKDVAKNFSPEDPDKAASMIILLLRKTFKKTLSDIDGVDA
jgi:hypothetical protein